MTTRLPNPLAYGRPPGIPTGRCAVINSNGYPCRGGAVWLLPDAAYCQSHLPFHLGAVVEARRRAWMERGAQLWADICTENPMP